MLTLLLLACIPEEADDVDVPTSGSVSVLTYNVHGLPDAVTNTERSTVERMEDIAPLLDDYDLVGLQEDFTDEGHAVLDQGASHPIREWFGTPLDDTRAYGSGLGIFSRVGSEDGYTEQYYSMCHGVFDSASDCLASKGVQKLSLSVGTGTLDVYNTHHEAGGGEEDTEARVQQVEEVLDLMEAESQGHAIVFLGDFNMRFSDAEDVAPLTAYVDFGLREACNEIGCAEPDRIDRVWVRDGDTLQLTVDDWFVAEEFVDDQGDDLSDHEAISVGLGWTTE